MFCVFHHHHHHILYQLEPARRVIALTCAIPARGGESFSETRRAFIFTPLVPSRHHLRASPLFSPLSSPSSLSPLDYVRVADGSVLEEECECNRVYGMSMSSMLYAVYVYVCMCYIIA